MSLVCMLYVDPNGVVVSLFTNGVLRIDLDGENIAPKFEFFRPFLTLISSVQRNSSALLTHVFTT